MDPLLTGIPWGTVGPVLGLAIFVILSVARGWLIPKITHDQHIQIMQQRIDDKDVLIAELRRTYEAVDKRNDELADQVRQLVEVGHTSAAALSALPRAGGR